MQRPGKDISFKAIRSRYTDRRGIELRERSSRSLLANVLDIGTVFVYCYLLSILVLISSLITFSLIHGSRACTNFKLEDKIKTT